MTQSITLVAIVRDELPLLPRMFASVEGLISGWVIVDTGSTDGTIEYLKERGDGELYHSEWKDFGSNRTEALRIASGSGEYLLLMDADLGLKKTRRLPNLTADAYRLEHTGGDDRVRFWIPRLLKDGLNWSFVGRTHEHLALDGEDVRAEPIYGVQVIDYADGSSHAVKYERDEKMLREDWSDPTFTQKERVATYLATTYSFLNRPLEQRLWLEKRLDMGGGNPEDLFYASVQYAALINSPEEMAKASIMRPHRIEPLAWFAQQAAAQEDWERAHHFTTMALALPYPEDDILFFNSTWYDYDLLFLHSVACYQIGQLADAIEASRTLLSKRLPDAIRVTVEANLSEYREESYALR